MNTVTIIIPTYLRPDFLFRALLSIKKQTFKDFTCVIFGDNCDHSERVYKDFFSDDSRFIYIKLLGNKVLNTGAVGRKIAMDYSDSKYICYLDDDNILLPNSIETLYNSIISSEKNVIISNLNHVEYPRDFSIFQMLNQGLYSINPICEVTVRNHDTMGLMHTKDACLAAGNWVAYNGIYEQYNEDGNFIVKLREFNDIYYVQTITGIYNRFNKSFDQDYKLLVAELQLSSIYVYPEIINNLKKDEHNSRLV